MLFCCNVPIGKGAVCGVWNSEGIIVGYVQESGRQDECGTWVRHVAGFGRAGQGGPACHLLSLCLWAVSLVTYVGHIGHEGGCRALDVSQFVSQELQCHKSYNIRHLCDDNFMS